MSKTPHSRQTQDVVDLLLTSLLKREMARPGGLILTHGAPVLARRFHRTAHAHVSVLSPTQTSYRVVTIFRVGCQRCSGLMGVLDRRGGGGLKVTVDASPSVDVHRPRSLRESRRASPYGRSPHEAARHNKLPPLPQQLAPTLPTPGTQLSHAIGGLVLAPISSRTRRATKAWGQPAAARHGRSPARESGAGAGAEFEAYLKLHGFTTERTPEERKKRTKGKQRAAAPHAAAPSHAVRGGDRPGVVASVPPVVPPPELVPQPPKQVGFNPNLAPRPPPPEEPGGVPARLAAVRAARGKRRHYISARSPHGYRIAPL